MDASATISSSGHDGGGLKVVTEPLMETSERENHVKHANRVGLIVANSLA